MNDFLPMAGFELLLVISTLVTLFIVQKALSYLRVASSIHNHPGIRALVGPGSALTYFLPEIPGISPGYNHQSVHKHDLYEYFGCDIYSCISIWPSVRASLFLADAVAIKEVALSPARFPKPIEDYKLGEIFGPNMAITEGEEWKRQRKIIAPAFSDRNYKMVWDETARIVNGLFDTVWGDREVIVVDHCLDVTSRIALFVISAAAFGKRLEWKDDKTQIPPGHTMSLKESLGTASKKFLHRAVFADWLLNLTEDGRRVKLAFDEMAAYMSEMVKERLAIGTTENNDLFTNLVASTFSHDFEAKGLTEAELLGNTFLFLLAGHENTADTLCFAFALLALYQDEQEILFKHIKSVLSNGRMPEHKDMPLLTQSMAVFYETLRLYAPAPFIAKCSAEDTTLNASNIRGEKTTIPVPKGTVLHISPSGVHYNPRYWEDPYAFKPSRFLRPDWPRDAFIPFSIGTRACIGRKFSETEGIAILTMVVAKYKITIKDEPQFASETFEQRKSRVLKSRLGTSLAPIRVPLVFSLRQ